MTSSFKDLLLYNVSFADSIQSTISDIAITYLLPVMMAVSVWEILFGNNINQVFKSLVISMMYLFLFSSVYKESVDVGFQISKEIISKSRADNSFIKTWKDLSKSSKLKEKRSRLFSFVDILKGNDDLVLSLLSILIVIIFVFLGVLYTLGYYLNFVFIGFSAIMGILPFSVDHFKTPIKGLLWSLLVPIVCASIIVMMGDVLSLSPRSDGVFAYSLKTYIELFVLALSLLLVLPGVYVFLDGKSFGRISAGVASRVATGMGAGAVPLGAYIAHKSTGGVINSRFVSSAIDLTRNAINKDANSVKSRFGIGNVDHPGFRDRYVQKMSRSDSAVAALFSPNSHAEVLKDTVKQNIAGSEPAQVFKSSLKENGPLRAVKDASIVSMDRIINRSRRDDLQIQRNSYGKRNFVSRGNRDSKPFNQSGGTQEFQKRGNRDLHKVNYRPQYERRLKRDKKTSLSSRNKVYSSKKRG